MSANIPVAPDKYTQGAESTFRGILGQILNGFRRLDGDVELVKGARVIIRSPDGTRWSLVVDNAGMITTVAL